MEEHNGTSEGARPRRDAPLENAATEEANLSLVVAVASSPVNSIVLSRIVQGAGLRAVHCTTDAAADTIHAHAACVVIVEEDAGEPDGNALRLAIQKRESSQARLPFVVSLSRSGTSRDAHRAAGADAVVAMPVTPDTLAPAILMLVERARREAAGRA